MNTQSACMRSDLRTNMFVMAVLGAAAGCGPVRIRNLSSQGALVEGNGLPQVNEAFELRRGSLAASGEVVRREGDKAGLRFTGPIDVSRWLPAGTGQQAVDRTFQTIKRAADQGPYTAAGCLVDRSDALPEQLERVARALDRLADDLSADPGLIVRHSGRLQALDIASQMLRKLAANA